MFTIEELQSKELDSLIPLAKELGIKKPASEKEDVIYQILDAQAENYASNAPQRDPRERRRKQSAQQVADSEDQQPKKRGRKPKAQQAEAKADEQQPVAAIAAEETAQPKKRGRKPKFSILSSILLPIPLRYLAFFLINSTTFVIALTGFGFIQLSLITTHQND